MVKITKNKADRLSSKKPKLKVILSNLSQFMTSLLKVIPVELVRHKSIIEYIAQIPVEIRVRFVVNLCERKLGTEKLR